jgi:hypothetical protein
MIATIKKSAKQYMFFFAILKTDQVHVVIPARGQINFGRPGEYFRPIDPDKFYQIDVAVLGPAQWQRLIQSYSRRWQLAPDVVSAWFGDRRNGIPLIAGDAIVAMDLFEGTHVR